MSHQTYTEAQASHEELLAEVRALRDIITKMDTWCRILDTDLTDLQDKCRRMSVLWPS
jgi:hypothetical protein